MVEFSKCGDGREILATGDLAIAIQLSLRLSMFFHALMGTSRGRVGGFFPLENVRLRSSVSVFVKSLPTYCFRPRKRARFYSDPLQAGFSEQNRDRA